METQEQIPEQAVASAPVVPPVEQKFPVWGVAIIVVLIGTGALLTWRSLRQVSEAPAIPGPTPTITATPTPIRKLSRLASESAFLTLEANVASLSGQLRTFVTDDPSLSPPVLELPLGF